MWAQTGQCSHWWLEQQQTCWKPSLLLELKACKNLQQGKQIHYEVVKSGFDSCMYVATALVNMYCRCNNVAEAAQVFIAIQQPDVVSWTSLITGYVENGQALAALELFETMKSRGCAPNHFTYVAALKACTSLALIQDESGKTGCLDRGREIHTEIGKYVNIYVQNTLVNMYSKCGSMAEARKVFDGIKIPGAVSWNNLIMGYAENAEGATALDLFTRMRAQDCAPTAVTYVAALKACISLAVDSNNRDACFERGRRLHFEMGSHLESLYLKNTLMDMYCKCSRMAEAQKVFNLMKEPTAVAYNTLMFGYVDNGMGARALDLFRRMKSQGCAPDCTTFIAALKACISLISDYGRYECLQLGKQIHLEMGLCLEDTNVQNILIDMYSKCGKIKEAREVFKMIKQPTLVSWNVLIFGYVENGEGATALELYSNMRSRGCRPNHITYAAALKACGLVGALETGSQIHIEIESGGEARAMLITSLVDFYAKCGSLEKAQNVFDSHPEKRDVTMWNALLSGYCRVGDEVVFELFDEMLRCSLQPDKVTFLCIFTCCSHSGLVEKGKECFEQMCKKYNIGPNVEHYTCMVDIYGRSNKIDEAIVLIRDMPCRPDTVIWLTVLGACRTWRNVGIGRLGFTSLLSMSKNEAAHLLMAQIYGSRGMFKEQSFILAMMQRNNGDDYRKKIDYIEHLRK